MNAFTGVFRTEFGFQIVKLGESQVHGSPLGSERENGWKKRRPTDGRQENGNSLAATMPV
ncbi:MULTISPECIES: hypothetical protein [unclassified Rhizobium]|uniref:hypothetical protein n=1 Tax=unclassified Rhizobium TaxID=2613769 RepID=UPI00138F04D9|nr:MULTISPECIES: hypothetical protein [unclassified Rhizobium]